MEEELSDMVAAEEAFSEEEGDFEFAFSIDSEPGSLPDTTADEIFYNGRIRPIYPVFNHHLIGGTGDSKEEENLAYEKLGLRSGSESSSSSMMSEAKELEQLSKSAPANFVPPSPDRWRKSSSTGSSAAAAAVRKWKLRDLVVGRSRSDGKERFLVIPPPIEKAKLKEKEKKEKSGVKGKGENSKEMDIVTAHRIYYGKVGSGGGQQASSGGTTRRSFLPYRQELLGGIFGNAKHHPF